MAKSNRMYPFKDKGKFFNYRGEQHEGISGVIRMCWRALTVRPQGIEQLRREWVVPEYERVAVQHSDVPLVQWLGHSTFLIALGGKRIITDPIFGVPSRLFSRWTPPGITFANLPSVDLILISHNHYDHLDIPSIKALLAKNPTARIAVPLGDKRFFSGISGGTVVEYGWWERDHLQRDSRDQLSYTFVPAIHWSRRTAFDRNSSLWGGWIIEWGGVTIYFAGDTAYGKHFSTLAQEFPSIDCALLPIGPCEPHDKMVHSHIHAEEAGAAFLELGARMFVPCHWGTFHFGSDQPMDPMNRLTSWWKAHEYELQGRRFEPLKIGQAAQVVGQALPENIDLIEGPIRRSF